MAILKYILESGTDQATNAVKTLAENGGKYVNGKNGKNGHNGIFNGNGNGNGKNGHHVDPVTAGAKKDRDEKSKAAALKALNKANTYTKQDFEQTLEIPVTAKLASVEQQVTRRQLTKGDIGRRTLPITDRVIGVAEVSERVKGPYRNRLRSYMAEHNDNLLGHMSDPEVGTLKVAGQEFRGKKTSIVKATGKPDAKLKNRGSDVLEGKRRWARMVSQTVDEADLQVYFKEGGHHKLELDLGAAITEGMPENQVKPFWSLVQRSYPYLFPGNHPKNLQRFELGFTDKLHKEVHRRLNKAGLRAKDVEKALRGRPTSEKFAFLEKVSGILEEIDEFMGKEMSKNMRRQARELRNT